MPTSDPQTAPGPPTAPASGGGAPSWDLLAVVVLLVAAGLHLRFLLLDRRVVRDLGLYHLALPQLEASLVEGRTQALVQALGDPAGWYNVLLALGARIFGRSPEILSVPQLLWVVLILLTTWLAARRLGGAAAGAAAVAVAATMPVLVLLGRMAWIHIPETALIGLGWVLLLDDPRLERWRSLVGLALVGVLAITLRPSGAPWVLSLLLPWLLSRQLRPATDRLVLLALPWTLALVVPARNLRLYLAAKAGARDRYAEVLPSLLDQLGAWLGVFALGLGLLAVVGLVRHRRRDVRLAVPLAWLLGALMLWALFRTGIDNFGVIGPGFAVLTGLGLVRLHRALPALALTAFALYTAVALTPADRLAPLRQLPLLRPYATASDSRSVLRPWTGLGGADLVALVDATCPQPRQDTCWIAVDQGLLEPFSEGPGQLELFLLDIDNTRLLPLREQPDADSAAVADALVQWDCPEAEVGWRIRFPWTAELLAELVRSKGLVPAWSYELRGGCFMMWMTPGGELADPDALPALGSRVLDAAPPPPRDEGPGRDRGPRLDPDRPAQPHPGAPLPAGPAEGEERPSFATPAAPSPTGEPR